MKKFKYNVTLLRLHRVHVALFYLFHNVWNSICFFFNLISFHFADIWKDFSQICSSETNLLIPNVIACNKCKKVLNYTSNTGTSNVRKHISTKHSGPEANLQSIHNFLLKDKIAPCNTDKQKLVEASVDLVSKDILPYTVVQGEGMAEWTRTLWNMGAKYGTIDKKNLAEIIPSAVTVSRSLKRIATEKKVQMQTIVSNAYNASLFLGVTCDLWQDKYRQVSYLGVTIHFFNDKMQLCDQFLALKPLDYSKRKDYKFIEHNIKTVLEEKGIPFDEKKKYL